MSRKLIVNADDFGRTHKVSEGIFKAHHDGIVTSASVMMNMPGAAHDLTLAASEAPKLALGVHLVFTIGRPLLPPEWVSSLIDEHGHFLTQDAIAQNPGRLNPDELLSEFNAQISTFKNVTGRLPDHIDCHHFVHVLPRLFAAYHDAALAHDLPMRIPFPRTEADLSDAAQLAGMGSLISDAMLKTMVRQNWKRLEDQPVRGPDHFIVSFFAGNVSVDHLLSVLDRLPDGVSELMTHPGFNDEVLSAESSYAATRELEIAALTDPRVKQHILDLGIELTTYAVT
jgi:hypothetical protein